MRPLFPNIQTPPSFAIHFPERNDGSPSNSVIYEGLSDIVNSVFFISFLNDRYNAVNCVFTFNSPARASASCRFCSCANASSIENSSMNKSSERICFLSNSLTHSNNISFVYPFVFIDEYFFKQIIQIRQPIFSE